MRCRSAPRRRSGLCVKVGASTLKGHARRQAGEDDFDGGEDDDSAAHIAYEAEFVDELVAFEKRCRSALVEVYARPAMSAAAAAGGGDATAAEVHALRVRAAALAEQLARRPPAAEGTGAPGGEEGSALLAAAEARAADAEARAATAGAAVEAAQARFASAEQRAADAERALAGEREAKDKAEAEAKELAAAYNGIEASAFEKEEEMGDLLVCLGQEEEKVERLRNALLERGATEEELDELLAGIGEDDDDEGGGEQGE